MIMFVDFLFIADTLLIERERPRGISVMRLTTKTDVTNVVWEVVTYAIDETTAIRPS